MFFVLALVAYYLYKFKTGDGADMVPQKKAIALKKHSQMFNQSVDNAMNAYFDMALAFVEADTTKVKTHAIKFIQLLDVIPMDELKKDTIHIYDIAMENFTGVKVNAQSILAMLNIREMRKDFSMVSENLYPLFKVINYEGENMYWQNCPMAFGEDNGANWVSKTTEVINPYLGRKHPEFNGTMLHCGIVKDTIKAQ